jgi:hypothetical protein
LNRFAEAHVIAEYGTASESVALKEKLDAFALIWAQLLA